MKKGDLLFWRAASHAGLWTDPLSGVSIGTLKYGNTAVFLGLECGDYLFVLKGDKMGWVNEHGFVVLNQEYLKQLKL